MNILIMTEKPAVSRLIAPFARNVWPSANINFMHVVPFTNLRFSYPRGLKLHEFPFLSEPRIRPVPWEEWRCPPLSLASDGDLVQVAMSRDLFTGADAIVCACDPDPTGVVAFNVLMEHVFGDARAMECPTMTLRALDDDSIGRALSMMSDFRSVTATSLEYGRIKRYFDWNWNVNSMAVLGETQRRAGVPADAPPLSKYALQLLYGMRYQAPMTDGNVARVMHYWQGTGRYKVAPGQWRLSLGSASSMLPIMDNLLAADLLDRIQVQGRHHLVVSERGHTLLRLLHPGCEDADLPFRLHAWGEQGAEAKPLVDRYIRTVFGRQLRFLNRTGAQA